MPGSTSAYSPDPRTVPTVILRVEGLVVSAGTKKIGPLSFVVSRGSGLAIVGPSGSGKTTLLRALARLEPPSAGQLTLADPTPSNPPSDTNQHEPREPTLAPDYRRRVVYCAQTPTFYAGTVRAALERPFTFRSARGRGWPEDVTRDRLHRMQLPEDILARPTDVLSVGERQRVALAACLSVEPDVLLLDEPTSALDPDAMAAVETLLLEAKTSGAALVLVTHDADQRARLTDETLPLAGAS